MGTELRLDGRLSPLTLARVVARLCWEQATGVLRVVGDPSSGERTFLIRDGVPVDAMSQTSDDALAEALVSEHIIDGALGTQLLETCAGSDSGLRGALLAAGTLTPRALHQFLSIRVFDSLVEAFRLGEGRFGFRSGAPREADPDPKLFVSPRELVEVGLHAALDVDGLSEYWAGIGPDPILRANPQGLKAAWAEHLNDQDRSVIALLDGDRTLQTLVVQMVDTLGFEPDTARLRLLTLVEFGVLEAVDDDLRALRRNRDRLYSLNHFEALGVSTVASVEQVNRAAEAKILELGVAENPRASLAVRSLGREIKERLERAREVLADDVTRAVYRRSLDLGVDLDRDEVRVELTHQYYIDRGKSLLTNQRYQEAKAAYQKAADLRPREPHAFVQMGWSQFLAGPQDATAAAEAARHIEHALKISGELASAYLTLGKVYRLAGELTVAESHYRRALELAPSNQEAQTELRLLFSREIAGRSGATKRGGRRSAAPRRKRDGRVEIPYGLLVVVVFAFAALFAGAHLAPGGAALDPRANAAYPPSQRTLGNLEYFFLIGDPWWWIRRIVLIAVGLVGLRVVAKQDPGDVEWMGEKHAWLGLAIPYGLLIGYFSPVQHVAGTTGSVLAMTLVHVLAEQIFFVAFVANTLLARLKQPALAIGGTALLFGAYHLTYLHITIQSVDQILLDCVQIGVFAGAAYGLLFWRSRGMLAPIIAHLSVNMVMMIRSVIQNSG